MAVQYPPVTFIRLLLKNWPVEGGKVDATKASEVIDKIHFRSVLAAFEDTFWPAEYYRSIAEPDNEFLIVLQRTRSFVAFAVRNSNLCLYGPAQKSTEEPIEVKCDRGVGVFDPSDKWTRCEGVDEANFSRKLSQEPNSTGEDLLVSQMR